MSRCLLSQPGQWPWLVGLHRLTLECILLGCGEGVGASVVPHSAVAAEAGRAVHSCRGSRAAAASAGSTQSLRGNCIAGGCPVGYRHLWAGLWGLGSWQGHSGIRKAHCYCTVVGCPVPGAWKLSWPNVSFSEVWTPEKRGKKNPLICRCVRTKKRSIVRKKRVHFQSCWHRTHFCCAKVLTD